MLKNVRPEPRRESVAIKNVVFRKLDASIERAYPSVPMDYFDVVQLLEKDLQLGEGQVGTIDCKQLRLQVHQDSNTPADDWRRIVERWMNAAPERQKMVTKRQVINMVIPCTIIAGKYHPPASAVGGSQRQIE